MNNDPTTRKRNVLAAAKSHLLASVENLRERVEDLKSVTLRSDASESASQTESRRGSDVELMNSLGDQVDHIKRDIALLDGIDPSVRIEIVQYGAVVHTDRSNFLVAASVEEFDANGTSYLGVSINAPLIQALSGMGTGDTVDFHGNEYTIKEIL